MSSPAPTVLAVIPARIGSTRLPRKALLDLVGRTVVQWVHDATVASGVFDRVVVATDDPEIASTVHTFGGECLMTSASAATGSDRVAEAAARLEHSYDVVANVQGDQPFVSPADLEALVRPYRDGRRPDMTTLAAPLLPELADDPSAVKVVTDLEGRALYFSRSRIPSGGDVSRLRHHIGLYAFRADVLPAFARLTPTPLEQAEQLEQLRALEHGITIVVSETTRAAIEINTPEDYRRALDQVSR